ncbi:MAG: hypothetical protein HYS81_02905 [Candidatus Aenigmatarchaeota archaeon]|nr:MAG: hypothetical protein HYS81_02905 [Candidatus Aenigmarchaeota archaeon]
MVDVESAVAGGAITIGVLALGYTAYQTWQARNQTDRARLEEGRRLGEMLDSNRAFDAFRHRTVSYGSRGTRGDSVIEGEEEH